jgi:hypothetical protein
MQWVLGTPHDTDDWDSHKAYRVRIGAEGPFGAIEPLEYVISFDDLDGSLPRRGISTRLQLSCTR